MADHNDADWNAEQFQLYASHKTEELEREVNALDHQIRDSAALTFRDPETANELIAQADAEGRRGSSPLDLIDRLNQVPGEVGKLRGDSLHPRQRAVALDEAKHLRVLVHARADAALSLRRYEDLWQKAHAAHRIQDNEERAGAVAQLRDECRYCDVTREVRAREHAERLERLEPADGHEPGSPFGPGSVGAARVPDRMLREPVQDRRSESDPRAPAVERQPLTQEYSNDEWWMRDLTEDDRRRHEDLMEGLRDERDRDR